MKASKAVLQALAVALELTRTSLSEAAARVMAADLARYPEAQVLGALDRCRRELRGQLSLADIITRLADGRPGPEEAWAMIPRSEGATVVWTDEVARAWGVAQPLLDEGDAVAARMAFLETYRKLVQEARDVGAAVAWTASLGHDPAGREGPLFEAARCGRLSTPYVAGLLPHQDPPASAVAALIERPKAVA